MSFACSQRQGTYYIIKEFGLACPLICLNHIAASLTIQALQFMNSLSLMSHEDHHLLKKAMVAVYVTCYFASITDLATRLVIGNTAAAITTIFELLKVQRRTIHVGCVGMDHIKGDAIARASLMGS